MDNNHDLSYCSPLSRVWLEVDLDGLAENYRRIQQAVRPCEVMPVLKANAYGLGVEKIAAALYQAGARWFGVADLSEALSLTRFGYQTQILGAVLPDEIEPALDKGVRLPLTDVEIARRISRLAEEKQCVAKCHVLVDSGMGRLGVPIGEAEESIQAMAGMPGLELEGVYSHFPVANQPENAFSQKQIGAFRALLNKLGTAGITFPWIHIANSDGINNLPESAQPPFNLVRSGINLYGAFDVAGGRAYRLHSVLTLKSRVVQVRRLPAGTAIGYGHTYRLLQDTLVGTISAGYADGVPVALSNRGYVLIQGVPCPILGRVSMDYCNVSLEPAPAVERGEEAVFIGGAEERSQITVQDWAELKASNTYDIICALGGRVARVYVGVD